MKPGLRGQVSIVQAELEEADGKRLLFGIRAVDARGVVGIGRVERVVVERERFLARLQ